MAGGEGTRLRPLTSNVPKPLVPVFNRPIMGYVLDLLKKHNVEDVMITLQYLPQMIKNYFGRGTDFGVRLQYSIEEQPLGTAGSVKLGEDFLKGSPFIVIAGDVFTDLDLTKLIKVHREKKAMVTIGLIRIEDPLEYGVVVTDPSGRIERFVEKPTWGEVISDTINTGIYICEPEILEFVPEDTQFDFSKDLFPLLMRAGKPLYGHILEGYWCDVGNFDQYQRAHFDVLNRKTMISPPGIKMLEDIWIGEGVYVHPNAELQGPVFIGQHARIEAGAEVDQLSVIGNNVVVSENSHIHRSIIADNSYIGDKATVNGAIIGKNCDVKKGARVEHGVVIGDACVINNNAVINHNVKIYPNKIVESGAVVNTSIIWESRGRRSIFGTEGASGLINVDISPDMALRLAMAFGTTLQKGGKIVASRDASKSSRVIKRALIAGLNATGVTVEDLRMSSIPINRFNILSSRAQGGIHVKTSFYDPQVIEIHFYDDKCTNLSTDKLKSIERYYYREDFRRAHYDEMGDIVYPARMVEIYVNSLLKAIDTGVIGQRNFKVVLDCAFNHSALIIPQLLGKLGIESVILNGSIDEDRSTLTREEVDANLTHLARAVYQFRADMGIMFLNGGENIYLIDDRGQRLTVNDSLHLFVELFCRYDKKKGKIALPVSVSNIAQKIAEANGRKVVRTKIGSQELMTMAAKKDTAMAGAQGGRYIFPEVFPAYDGFFSFLKLLQYLAIADTPLSTILKELPSYYLMERSLYCPFEKKGNLMRLLPEWRKDMKLEFIEGVKFVNEDEWVLVVPDSEDPVVRIYCESKDGASTERLLDQISLYVKSLTA